LTTHFDPQAAATAGAAWLDANRPGWAQEIKLSALDIEDSDYSVRGQLYGGEDESITPWGNDTKASLSISYGLSSPDGDHWPLQLAWFDRLAERGVEIPASYRDREQWERRLWQEILIIDWPYYQNEGYLRMADASDPAHRGESVWREVAYVVRFDGDEGYFEPISDHDATVAEIEGRSGTTLSSQVL
jgi:hypothetical protein